MMCFFFFFNDTATTEIYTFPYTTLFRSRRRRGRRAGGDAAARGRRGRSGSRLRRGGLGRAGQGRRPADAHLHVGEDRKSTRLNSSHANISYAVFCLKKKTTPASTPFTFH